MIKSFIEIYNFVYFCLFIRQVNDIFSYNVRFEHFKMDCLYKELKKLTSHVNKMLFMKHLCLHIFGSLCCAKVLHSLKC
jgi:hypothetical protein